jgi:hypothetical protein
VCHGLPNRKQHSRPRSLRTMGRVVDDDETNKITSTFYKYMVDESGRLDHARAAFALNKTMKIVHSINGFFISVSVPSFSVFSFAFLALHCSYSLCVTATQCAIPYFAGRARHTCNVGHQIFAHVLGPEYSTIEAERHTTSKVSGKSRWTSPTDGLVTRLYYASAQALAKQGQAKTIFRRMIFCFFGATTRMCHRVRSDP